METALLVIVAWLKERRALRWMLRGFFLLLRDVLVVALALLLVRDGPPAWLAGLTRGGEVTTAALPPGQSFVAGPTGRVIVLPYLASDNPRLFPNGYHGDNWRGRDYTVPAGAGATLVAPVTGEVVRMGTDAYCGPWGCGNSYVLFRAIDGTEVMLMHGRYSVTPGQRVRQCEPIGAEASIGNSSEPHTHFSVRKDGRLVDPLDLNVEALCRAAPLAQQAQPAAGARLLAVAAGRDIVHQGKLAGGNHGSVLGSYYDVGLRMSHYDPAAGGINCDADCSTMASGDKVADWVGGRGGVYAAACPQEWGHGTKFTAGGEVFECRDRGGWINCYAPGDYDPALKRAAESNYCWVDTLGSFGWSYGQMVTDWNFVK